MTKRDFLAVTDLARTEILSLFELARRMKSGTYRETPLAGKTLAMIFAKSSTRTRVSFEVGTYQLGGQALFLSSRDIQLGRGEPIPDTARVLSRYVNGIMIRTFDHGEVEELARHATIPVINGLTDLSHPCQVLADLFTVREALGGWDGKRIAWVGDGNNMANSWIEAAQVLGFELRLACPEGYEPDRRIFDRAKAAGACISITEVPEEAVDRALMKLADPTAIFLHCLPAHRGEEVATEVIEGPQSRVWDEAENRLHVQKALLGRLRG